MPGVHVAHDARPRVDDSDKQREVDFRRRVRVQIAVQVAGQPREILFPRQAGAQRGLDVGHQERGTDALPGHVAHQHRDLARGQHEVVEEVAADLARGNGDALHLGEPEAERLARQQVVLDLPAQLQLALQTFLLDDQLLVPGEVLGHLVERGRQASELVGRSHGHPGGQVSVRDCLHALHQRAEIPRHAAGERHAREEHDDDEAEAHGEVADRDRAQFAQLVADRPRGAEGHVARALTGDDDPVAGGPHGDAVGRRSLVSFSDSTVAWSVERGA